MRKLGFALAGIVTGVAVAGVMALPQTAGSQAVDTQGLHLIGALFVALPLGAVVGAVLGLLVERVFRP